jgi:O-antigen ligase
MVPSFAGEVMRVKLPRAPALGHGAWWASPAYVSILLAYPVITAVTRLRISPENLALGERVDVWVQALTLAIAWLVWLLAKPAEAWSSLVYVFLATTFMAWIVFVVVVTVHGDEFRREYLAAGSALIMLILKPISYPDLLRALRILFVCIVAGTIATLPLWRILSDSSSVTLNQIPQFFGLDRSGWYGFAPGVQGHFGTTGAVVAMLAFAFSGVWRWTFVVFGLVIVFVVGSSGTIPALVAGVIVLALGHSGRPRIAPLIAGLGVFGASLIFVYLSNPTGSGRLELWTHWLGNWADRPILGWGVTGIVDFAPTMHLSNGVLNPVQHMHAHNFFVDALTRVGLVGLTFMLIPLIIAVIIGWQALQRNFAVPLAAVSVLLIAGQFDIEPYFNFWSIGLMLLTLSVLLSRQVTNQDTPVKL